MIEKDKAIEKSQIVYYRAMFLLASVLYPLWYYIVNWLMPHSIDSLEQRVAIGLLIFLGYLWSFHPKSSHDSIRNLFIIYANIVCLHIYVLVGLNDFSGFYQLVAIVAYACIAAAMPTKKMLGFFILFNTFAVIGIAIWKNESFYSMLFLSCILTLGFTFWPPLSMRMALLHKINMMRRELDIIVSNAAAGIAKADSYGVINTANSQLHLILGYEEGKLVGESLSAIFQNAGSKEVSGAIAQILSGNFSNKEFNVRLPRMEGMIWIRVRSSPIWQKGIVTGSIWVINDVTSEQENQSIIMLQKSLLEKLVDKYTLEDLSQETAAILSRYLDKSEIYIWKPRRIGSSIDVERLGYVFSENLPRETLIIPFLKNWYQEVNINRNHEELAKIETQEVQLNDSLYFLWHLPLCGYSSIFLAALSRNKRRPDSFDERVIGTVSGLFRVGEEKLRAEETILMQQSQITQSAKMASLGEMAGGIAHEINNPLAVLRGRFEQMKSLLNAEDINREQMRKFSESGIQMVDRMKKIIQGLRQFSRDGAKDPMVDLCVNDIVQDTLVFCKEKFALGGVELICEPISKEVVISGRHTQISQVILNVLHNAFDAVSQLEKKWVNIRAQIEGEKVKIFVTDSGLGIPKETVDRIFQPFFTTKSLGQGTGLGLSISLGIIKDHGGFIAYNENSKNTQFVIELPFAKGRAETETTKSDENKGLKKTA